MNLTNREIYEARESLNKLFDMVWPIRVSFKLAELIAKLSDPFANIEKVRQGLIKRYGVSGENGKLEVKPDNEKWEEFIEQVNDLMEQKVEVVFEPIELPEIVGENKVELKPNVLVHCMKFITIRGE